MVPDIEVHTLHEQRKESDHEHQEDTVDATFDPVKDWIEVVAPSLIRNELARSVEFTDRHRAVQRAEEDHCVAKYSEYANLRKTQNTHW